MLIQNIACARTYKKLNLQLNEDRYVTKYSLGAQIIDVMLFALAIIIQRSFFFFAYKKYICIDCPMNLSFRHCAGL